MRDPESFPDRREPAEQAATIVDRMLRPRTKPHTCPTFRCSFRSCAAFHFRTPDGVVLGSTFIDPVWARIVAWNADDVPPAQRHAARQLVAECLNSRGDLLRRFDALADA